MIKAICVNNGKIKNLTLGKYYHILTIGEKHYRVINDLGLPRSYSRRRFAEKDTWRDILLNEILE